MKITVTIAGEQYRARMPYAGATHVEVIRGPRCCTDDPLRVHGAASTVKTHDTLGASAYCVACGRRVGTITVQVGVEEDRRVLGGPWRVC